ncbi:hypothetical protein H6A19_14250 [Clostridium saudiense]|uniref:Uncharacterized protein n=1 Tax=Clostridium saudiense TaxID=1414720 RepID=A0ABS2FIU9_9CLOT|nr:hypothetical protein [Clostridium saudiense]MBM6820480.1 hypothetical protein [Clostridium saudiense]
MVVLIVWIIMAYVCYDVAQKKGLNSGMWGVLGLIFGIFALMILVMIPSKRY